MMRICPDLDLQDCKIMVFLMYICECQAPLLPKNGSGWRLPASLLSSCPEPPAPFGIMFDIDGVIVRGRKVLPFAPEERILGTFNF
jgi:hypothetical protein